ncbi:MAG TPA: anti-sigma factor [Candidatus Dormibacteraeota bacterium]|jgi:mycothiol system anti-sigma-R factor|nr:anti-sigma factor [Candidatus Dormibacteraeota bacterium]
MTCDASRSVLHAYLDGELDAPGAAEFEQHLEGCTSCTRTLEAQESLRSTIQRSQLYEPLPLDLENKIRRQLRESSAPATRKKIYAWRWLAAAAAIILLVGVSWKVLPKFRANSDLSTSAAAAEIVDAHIRSLQPGHLTDVTSTDQHTVKPWFDGKVPFAPPVRDFAEEGFPLIGGRLDVLQGQTVAALVYGRRKHFISVFVFPEHGEESEKYSGAKNGYQWISWRQGELRLCAVSDTNRDDLAALKDLISR